jgi:hypothetical protein
MMIFAVWTQVLVTTGICGFDPVKYFSMQKNMVGRFFAVFAGIFSLKFNVQVFY